MMMDGSFKNTRLFKGTYEMWPFETCGYPCEEDYDSWEEYYEDSMSWFEVEVIEIKP